MLDHLYETLEPLVQFYALLTFAFFQFEFVHVIQSFAVYFHVKIISCITSFLEELNILHFAGAHHNGGLEVEVDDHSQLIIGTGLEEGVLHVGEGDVDVVALLRGETHTVLVDL